MTYSLQMSCAAKSIEPRCLVIRPSKSPIENANFVAEDNLAIPLTNLIPQEWEDEFQLLYAQERAIIAKRRELVTKYSIAFTDYIHQHHPEILI